MSLASLYWNEPLWLLIALQPGIIWLLRWARARRQLDRYADSRLHPWVVGYRRSSWQQRLLNRHTAYFAAWLCFAVAAAGPRIIEELPDNTAGHGIDIMAVIDISRSMHVQDASPNRLGRGSRALQALLPQLQQDRLGMVVYAGRPHQYMPLTYDKNVMRHYLANLDNLRPPTDGSRTTAALQLAEQLLRKQAGGEQRNQAILLLTDGEDLPGPPELETPVFVLGLGSVEGDAIPGYKGDWLRDDNRVRVSRLQEDALSELARLNHGRYSRATQDNRDWDILYKNGIQAISQAVPVSNNDNVIWHELYAYALLPGILLLLLSTMSFKPSGRGPDSTSATKLATLLIGLALLPAPDAQAGDSTVAYRAFIENDYPVALEQYEGLEGYPGRFGEGASAYRLKDYARAIAAFKQAFLAARDDRQRATALYNLGNSYFQSGDYPAAIAAYRDAMVYQPGYPAAQRNIAFSQKLHATVQQRLARLRKLLRPDRGAQEARAEANMDTDDTSVSIDESNDELELDRQYEIDLSGPLAEALILKGIEHAWLASEAPPASLAATAHAEISGPAVSSQQLDVIHDDQEHFWNRILEVEEGFPAPLDKPNKIRGVAPW
ncbi:VWA domain-containing protein [Sulfuriflexus sp.]|uniref:VWA domain-containing protein n=1 Tax=Sulfuriflexus sp. TaxID=2015443 RepID=UPI0028CE1012|nr:VWA domain-containing protein [Sulfuriflexus sp.]MDT8405187.1 VWA domain-containing protein [Sulfuriflexus sp.]